MDPWFGKIPGGGHDSPVLYSCLKVPMDRGVWWAVVYGVTQSDITEQLSVYALGIENAFPTKILVTDQRVIEERSSSINIL